jgi:hypothetical protein
MALDAMKKIVVNQPYPKLNSSDSSNVYLGLLKNHMQKLMKQDDEEAKADSKRTFDQRMEIIKKPGYMLPEERMAPVSELMTTLIKARNEKKPLSSYKISPEAIELHKNIISPVGDSLIAANKHLQNLKAGSAVNENLVPWNYGQR